VRREQDKKGGEGGEKPAATKGKKKTARAAKK